MGDLLIALAVIYLLSPIPLIIVVSILGVKYHRAKKKNVDAMADCTILRTQLQEQQKREANYRNYVNQLQRKLQKLDPSAVIGKLENEEKPAPKAPSSVPVSSAFRPAIQDPETSQPSVATPVPTPTYTPVPAPTPVQGSVPVQPSVVPAGPSVPAPVMPAVQAPAGKGNSLTIGILTAGVILLLLASVGFISATWSVLSIGIRAICLFSFSAIFLGAGILARTKLKLPNTSLAFYSIGSAALPITILGAGAFELFGKTFSMRLPYAYNTWLLAFSCLFILLFFGAAFFRSRVFACGSLVCASSIIFTLALRFRSPYQLNVLLIALFSGIVVFAVPLAKKIPETSRFHGYSKVYEIYSIANIYVMAVVALALSKYSLWSGIFLLLLGAAFMFATPFMKKANGLLSLPSIVLILVGTAQIIHMDSMLTFIIWMIVAAACFLALSYMTVFQKYPRYVFFGVGLSFLITVSVPTLVYMLSHEKNWAFLAFTILTAGALVFLSINKKHPVISAAAILPVFTLIWGTVLRLVPVTEYSGFLTATIISGVLYLLFTYIPHQRFFTTTGNLVSLGIFATSAICLTGTLENQYHVSYAHYIFMVFFILLSLTHAYRKDHLNVRNKELDQTPMSITVMRSFYACTWPLYCIFAHLASIEFFSSHSTKPFIRELILILISFAYMVLFILRSGTAGIFAVEYNDEVKAPGPETRKQTYPRCIAFFTSAATGIVTLIYFSILDLNPEVYPSGMIITQHILPLLIPIIFLIISLRLKKLSSLPGSGSCIKPSTLFWNTLLAMFSFAAFLPNVLTLYDIFKEPSYVSFDSLEFLFSTEFIYAVAVLISMVYFLCLYFRKDSLSESTADGKYSFPTIGRIFGKALSPWSSALFVWTMAFTVIVYLQRLSLARLNGNILFAILLTLILISYIVLFKRNLNPIPLISSAALTLHLLLFMHEYLEESWTSVLLFQIPVVLLLIAALYEDKRNYDDQPEHLITNNGFFWSAFTSQIVVCLATPVTLFKYDQALAQLSKDIDYPTFTSHIIDSIWKTLSFTMIRSRIIFFTLLGILLIELTYLWIRKESEVSRRRGIGLIITTLSTIAWMPILTFPALCMVFEPAYLLPTSVLVLLLPWIFPKKQQNDEPYALAPFQFVYSCIAMGFLSLIVLIGNNLYCLLFLCVVSLLILLLGYYNHKKKYFILGLICTIGLPALIVNHIWGSMAWLVYLFTAGAVLVTIAVRNEIKKRA